MDATSITVLLVTDDKALRRTVTAACADSAPQSMRVECVPPSKMGQYWQCDVCVLDATPFNGSRHGSLQDAVSRLRGIPVVALVPDDSESAAFEALRAGAGDYLCRTDVVNPILLHAIHRAYLRSRAAEESGTYRGLKLHAEESEEKYRTVIENAGEPIAVYDEAGLCHFMNEVGAARLGMTSEDAAGRTMWDLFPQVIAEAQMGMLREVIHRQCPKTVEFRSVIRDEPRWYHAKIVPMKTRPGGMGKALVFAIDITEMKCMEEALREREESARAFQNQLMALHEVTTILTRTDSLDELWRYAVQLGRSRLGFDRMGIWLIGEETRVLKGTYGTGEDGRLRDERARRHVIDSDEQWNSYLARNRTPVVQHNETLRDDNYGTVGYGDFACAGLWDGDSAIGSIVVDTLISGHPITEAQCRLLTLYASTVGSLYAIRRKKEELQLFKSVIDSSEEAIVISDEKGAFVYGNQAYRVLFGEDCAPGSRTLDDICPPKTMAALEREIMPALMRGDSWEGELALRHSDGRILTVWQRVGSLRDTDGNLLYGFSIMHDVSERRAAEEAIRQSEERFRAQYKHFPLPTVTWRWNGQDFELSNYNDAMMDLTRGHIGEYMGIMAKTFHGDDPGILGAFEQCLETQRAIHQELWRPLKTTGGEPKLFSTTYVFVPPDSVMVHLDDITERERAARALRESEARYRELLDFMTDVVWRTDMNGSFTFMSPVVKQMTGYEPDELIGRPCEVVLSAESGVKAREALRRRERGEIRDDGIVLELTFRRKDGTEFIGELRSSTLRDCDGRLIGIQGTTRDITERRRADRVMADQHAKMITASRLSSLGVMASGLAHEINNPLAIISGGAEQLVELVKAKSLQPDRIEKVSDTIQRNVVRIERIVRGLRNLSRDSTGDPFRKTSLKTMVDDIIELCRARFLARDIAITVQGGVEPLVVECRATLVAQVLLNLLGNAYDAVAGLADRWVRVELSESETAVEIVVTDSGPGIDAELAERIFEPFFSTKEVGKGTGLGLSISRGIIESHDGALTLDMTSPNTRFVIRLPKRQPQNGVPNHA